MYVLFVILFLVSNTREGSEEEVCGWGDANLLVLFLNRARGIRAGCRQEKCHAKAKGKDRAFDWPMDPGLKCKSAKFFRFFPV